MPQTTQEREIFFSQGEFSYIQDTTNGVVSMYVGPAKKTIGGNDRVVKFDSRLGRFISVSQGLEGTVEGLFPGVQKFICADSSQYVILENPTSETRRYQKGSNEPIELDSGRKQVISGPVSMPLWPGQVATVINGHRLREDEYLISRLYESREENKQENPEEKATNSMHIGTERVIKGSDISFYIPDNGWEVVPVDERIQLDQRQYVRKAVKLKDGEYCALIDPNGTKHYLIGPEMVIPEPYQEFERDRSGNNVFKAKTLRPEKGLHLSVVKDFEVKNNNGTSAISEQGEVKDNDAISSILEQGKYKMGQEIFVSGKDGLFFPNENLEVKAEVLPISLAANEGVYVRDLSTGTIQTITGPVNFLPDPTKQELVKKQLKQGLEALCRIEGRDQSKAVSVYVKPNTAMLVISESERKVIKGPKTHLLDYTDDLETLALSTGTPKTDREKIKTVFLQVNGNRVSDEVPVETQDHANLQLRLSYRINFEGEDETNWFNVNDYVGLLCDHLRSVARGVCQRHTVEEFYKNSAEILRDAVLGVKGEKAREGRKFNENAMRVYDLEVLDVLVEDEDVRAMLETNQRNVFKLENEKRAAEREYDLVRAREAIIQDTNNLKIDTYQSEQELLNKQREVQVAKKNLDIEIDKISQVGKAINQVEAAKVQDSYSVEQQRIEDERVRRLADEKHQKKLEMLAKQTDSYKEMLSTLDPRMAVALEKVSDEQSMRAVVSQFGQLAAIEGKTPWEIFQWLYKGGPLEQVAEMLKKDQTTTNQTRTN